jgi:hypothetical protein
MSSHRDGQAGGKWSQEIAKGTITTQGETVSREHEWEFADLGLSCTMYDISIVPRRHGKAPSPHPFSLESNTARAHQLGTAVWRNKMTGFTLTGMMTCLTIGCMCYSSYPDASLYGELLWYHGVSVGRYSAESRISHVD